MAGKMVTCLLFAPGEAHKAAEFYPATFPDRAAAKRAMAAMMTMRRIDIAPIEVARAG